ncbi:3-oxoacyl-[acyl-carrier-protein] reductase [Clostridium acidisoli DSM 12555]|jgi:3-oxoacyl-[acyl-carrier protein] reductase|uniref:3-oxoacyl-[acyl-carrier-protein] reductase n=1 Tax=Clostridium acidisoli DSM 12555 TaxID=1121291 RepID=A0A1W1XQT7_9CLOT|nr:3-oxoacyl-[acyl-carrier-protein] reductase [Clostridium acidisoli]SMC26234.1 3-oxoacyl-[acyl-carrier-protein] reductase [Clostridium acidisoli DSM 12555]
MSGISLQGKTAVITGASRGIGKAIALSLAELGANIVVNYRSTPVDELVKEIEAKGVKAIAVKADVSKFDEAEELIKEAVRVFGTLDILINNAGITKDGLVIRMKEEDFDKVIEVNLKGAFNTIRHASGIMLKKRSGRIINITSVVGITGNAGQLNYSSAKAGLIGMTKSLARELGSRGVTVNAVAPGFIQSDMTDKLSDKQKEAIMSGIPLKKAGNTEDVANAVAFLVSDMASYITGQVVNVDGGMVMQ